MKTLVSILTLLFPLKVELGWLSDKVAIERAAMVGHASAFGSLCITIASVILAFKMLRMYYMIASDEQNGGFGGVSLKEIFRPLLIFFLLFNISPLMRLVDTSVNYVSAAASGIVSVQSETDFSVLKEDENLTSKSESEDLKKWRDELKKTYMARDDYKEAIKVIQDTEKDAYTYSGFGIDRKEESAATDLSTIESNIFNTGTSGYGGILNSFMSGNRNYIKVNGEEKQFKGGNNGGLDENKVKAYNDAIGTLNELHQSYKDGVKELKRADRKASRGMGLVNKIVSLLFTLGSGLLLGFAEIMLTMFGMFAPLVLTLSLIDKWRDAFWGLLAKYLEISMWKPIALFMIRIISEARTSLNAEFAQQLKDGVFNAASGSVVGDGLMNRAISQSGVAFGNIMICLVGLWSIFKVPSIATQVMNLGTGGAAGDMAGAGMAMGMAGAKLAGGVAKGTAKAGATVGVGAVSGAVAGAAGGGGLKGAISGARFGAGGALKSMGNQAINSATIGNTVRTDEMGINMDNFSKGSERTKAMAAKFSAMKKPKPKGGGRK